MVRKLGANQIRILSILARRDWLTSKEIVNQLYPDKLFLKSYFGAVRSSIKLLVKHGIVKERKIEIKRKRHYRYEKSHRKHSKVYYEYQLID